MNPAVKTYFSRTLKIGAVVSALILLTFFVIPLSSFWALLLGYLLSFLFVASNFFVIRQIDTEGQKKFLKHFFGSLVARFVLVLSAFALVLVAIKIDQILFTVSFIISYILHSVIEVIFINKILENENQT